MPASRLASLPMLQRRLSQPRTLPKTSTPIESESTLPQRTDPQEVQASSTLMPKRVTLVAPRQTTSIDLVPTVAMNLSRARRTEVDRPADTPLSASPSRARLEVESSPSSRLSELQTLPSTTSSTELTGPRSTAARVDRQTATLPSPTSADAQPRVAELRATGAVLDGHRTRFDRDGTVAGQ